MDKEMLFDKSLQQLSFLYVLSGLTLDIRNRKYWYKIRDRCLYIFNFLWLNTDVLGEIYWIIVGASTGKNFTELTYVTPCNTLCFLANWKAFFHVYNEDIVSQLISKIRELEIRENKRHINNANDKKNKIIKEEIHFLNIVIKALNFFNLMTVIAFSFSPLVLMALKYRKTNEVELMTPFLIAYPVDPYDMRYWPYAYLHQEWSACIVILQIGGVDCLFYVFCTYIKIQFRMLQQDFESLIIADNKKKVDGTEIKNKLISLVHWHQNIINSVNMLETIYTKSTLFNFVSSSFIICLTGFNVTAIDDVAFILSFLTFLLMSLLQIFLLCLFGDMILRSSIEISDAVYNSKWYLVDTSLGKKLFMIQMRAQKPCKLTASGYADVNLKAFMKILSTSWSYFALLNTIYSTKT